MASKLPSNFAAAHYSNPLNSLITSKKTDKERQQKSSVSYSPAKTSNAVTASAKIGASGTASAPATKKETLKPSHNEWANSVNSILLDAENGATRDQLMTRLESVINSGNSVLDDIYSGSFSNESEFAQGVYDTAMKLRDYYLGNSDELPSFYDVSDSGKANNSAQHWMAQASALRESMKYNSGNRDYTNAVQSLLDSAQSSLDDAWGSSGYLWPVDGGTITSGFGYRKAPTAGASTNHQAVDIGAAEGTPIYAAADGVVNFSGANGGYGNTVKIGNDDGLTMRYSHMASYTVRPGERVKKGDVIGYVGQTGIATGPHLDFGVYDPNGNAIDPTSLTYGGSEEDNQKLFDDMQAAINSLYDAYNQSNIALNSAAPASAPTPAGVTAFSASSAPVYSANGRILPKNSSLVSYDEEQEEPSRKEKWEKIRNIVADFVSNPVYFMENITGSAVDSIASGYSKIAALATGIFDKDAANKIEDFSKANAESSTAYLQEAKDFLGNTKVGDILANTGVAGMQMFFDVLGGSAAGVGAMAPMLARSFGSGALEGEEKGLDVAGQIAYGVKSASIEYFTEKLFGGNPAYDEGKGLVNRLAELVIRNEKVLKAFYSTTADVLSEGIEEILSDVLNPAVDYVAKCLGSDIEVEWPTVSQLIEDGIVGSLLGGAAKAAAFPFENAVENDRFTAETNGVYADPENVRALVNEALELNPESRTASKIQKKLDSGKQISTASVRKLVDQNEEIIRTLETEDTDAGIPESVYDEDAEAVNGTTVFTPFAEENTAQIAEEAAPVNAAASPVVQAAPVQAAMSNAETNAPNAKNALEADSNAAKALETKAKTKAPADAAIEEASKKYGKQAGAFVHTYQRGQDVEKFDAAYQSAFDYGKTDTPFNSIQDADSISYLTEKQRELAYEAGQAAQSAETAEQDKTVNGKANGKTGRRIGAVRMDGVKMDELNEQQKRGARVALYVAEATGLDIVLYKSEKNGSGKYTEAQGRFERSDPDKLYIDVNAGLANVHDESDIAKYVMLRTMTHELTHAIEYWNRAQYNELRKVVFDELVKNGENVDDLITDVIRKQGLSYDAASREVVAEAMTDILPDSSFIQNLCENHRTLFNKLLDEIKRFVSDLKAYFKTVGANTDKGANALRKQVGDTVKYLDSIVEAFDRAAAGAVENFQRAYATEETAPEAETAETSQAPVKENVPVEEETAEAAPEVVSETEKTTAEEKSETAEDISDDATVSEIIEAIEEEKTVDPVPPKAETEQAKKDIKKAVRIPVQKTNKDALIIGLNTKELSMDNVTLPGKVDGFNMEQRAYLVKELIEGAYSDKKFIKVSVPFDGVFEVANNTETVANILSRLNARVTQDIVFNRHLNAMLKKADRVAVSNLDGQWFVTDGVFAVAIDESAKEYATSPDGYKASVISFDKVKPAVKAEGTQIIGNAYEMRKTFRGVMTTGAILKDDTGVAVFIPKNVFSYFNTGNSFTRNRLAYLSGKTQDIVVCKDANGNIVGFAISDTISEDEMENVNLDTARRIKIKSINEETENVEAIHGQGVRGESVREEAAEKPKNKAEKKPDLLSKTQENTKKIVESTEKLDDFGEKIGGARKDWRSDGLLVSDLSDMNDRERQENVKKDNVWKRPNYKKMVEDGRDRGILYAVNEIRKAIPATIYYGHGWTEEVIAQKQRKYVETVRAIQSIAETATSKKDFAKIADWLIENGYIEINHGYPKSTEKYRSNPALAGGTLMSAIARVSGDKIDLVKEADKANFAVDAKSRIPAGFNIRHGAVRHVGSNTDMESWYITKGSFIVQDGFQSYEDALSFLQNMKQKKDRKTRFVPPQLTGVHRRGPDYRSGANVDGQDYIDKFGFRGGEFGNWMTEKDRRVSMNYGYDALMDLADALNMDYLDISLGGNLSIAFGARGQGLSGASAHYEPARHVINLTKMNGAGSLAHEWFHALDDYIGGYSDNFATDHYYKLPENVKAAVRNLVSTMQYTEGTQEETDLAAQKRVEQYNRHIQYMLKDNFGWVQKVEAGTFNSETDGRYFASTPSEADAAKFRELEARLVDQHDMSAIDDLSALRKKINGHVISKADRDNIALYSDFAKRSATEAPTQKVTHKTQFYRDSRAFGDIHSKDGDYWDSTIEMAARAFACYIADKTGKQNDYLSAHSDSAVAMTEGNNGEPRIIRAFPVGEERVRINAAFDQLVAALKDEGFLHEQEEIERPSNTQYQAREVLSNEADTFRKSIDRWDNAERPEGDMFILGSTGSVLQGLGAIESDVYILSEKIKKIFNDHPEISIKEIKNIPEILENPVLVLASRNSARVANNTRLVVFGMVKADNKLPVAVTFDLSPVENRVYLSDMQKVVSAYTKDRSQFATKNLVQNSEVLYADDKAALFLHTVGFQNAHRIEQSGFVGNISYVDDRVNITGKSFSDVFEYDTQYQTRVSALTNRDVLDIASSSITVEELNDGEADSLRVFRGHLDTLREIEEQRAELGQLYKEQQFGESPDRAEAEKTLNRMHVLDEQIQRENDALLSIENKPVLRRVLDKSRKVIEQEERKHGQELLRRYRDRQKNAADIRKYKDRIKTDTDTLKKWILHPINKNAMQHVPDALKNSVIPFLTSIDFTSKQQLRGGAATKADVEFKKRLAAVQAAIKENADIHGLYSGYSDLPEGFMDEMQNFVDAVNALPTGQEFIINQMTADELKTLSRLVRVTKKLITQMNAFHQNAMFRHSYDAGENSVGFMSELKRPAKTGKVSDFVLWQNMRPAYAFERFGDGGKSIFRELSGAYGTYALNTKKIVDFAEKTYTKEEVNAWEKEIKTFNLGGDTVRVPVSYIMGLYELNKRPQAREHLLVGGLRVATYKTTAAGKKVTDVGHALTKGDIDAMIGTLTARQKAVADMLQQFMAKQGGEWGNYVSVARFGEEQFGEEHYYPINSDGQHLKATADEYPSAASLYALLNMSFTKELQEGANNRVILYSIFDVFSNHMASMAQYNAFALPVLDSLKWLNYQQRAEDVEPGETPTGVREQMARAFGMPEEKKPGSGNRSYAESFVLNIIKAINGTETQGIATDNMGVNALHRFNMAQVAFNLRVAIQQPMAITRAGMIISYGDIIRGLSLSPSAIRANAKEMYEHSGIAAWKGLGFYDVNISRSLTEIIKHDESFMDKVDDAGMKMAEKADEITWAAMWNACKKAVERKQHLSPKDARYFDAVNDLFDEVIYKTQVVDSVLTKPEFIRSKGFFARAVGSFMSEPTTTASMVFDAVSRYQMDMQRGMSMREAWQQNKGNIGKTFYVYSVSAVLLSAVEAIADAWRDDDEYADFWDKLREAFKENAIDELIPINKLPLASDAYELIKSILDALGVDTYGNEPRSVLFQWRDGLIKACNILNSKLKGSGDYVDYTWYGFTYNLLKSLSGASGIPAAAITREVVSAWNSVIVPMAPSLRVIFPNADPKRVKTYDAGAKSEIKWAYKDGYLTEDEAIAELVKNGVAKDDGEAYFVVKGWDMGTDSAYISVYDAMQTGGDFDAAVKEMTDHGYEEKKVLSQAAEKIGEWYKAEEISEEEARSMLQEYAGKTEADATSKVAKWKYSDWDVDGGGITQEEASYALESSDFSQTEKEAIWNEFGWSKSYADVQEKAQARIELDENAVTYNSANWMDGLQDSTLSDGDKDALVNAYGSKWFASPYQKLRDEGLSPKASYNLLISMDEDGNHSIKQAEAYAVLRNYSEAEAVSLWNAIALGEDWATDYYTYRAKQ